MNTAHWHLLLNHLPVVGIITGTGILIAAYFFRNNIIVKRTALGVFIYSAVMAIPAFLTGEGAEEIVEKLAGVTESNIEKHEDIGKIFLILASSLGILSVLALIMDLMKNKLTNPLYSIILILSLGTSIYAKQVGTSGGEIRHSEIRQDVTATSNGNSQDSNAAETEKDDEGDD